MSESQQGLSWSVLQRSYVLNLLQRSLPSVPTGTSRLSLKVNLQPTMLA